jgi:pentatricopeptide repeat protein
MLSSSTTSPDTTQHEMTDKEELWPKALDLLNQMNKDGIEPDGFCYSSAINCCGAEGRWEEACKLIETMKRGGPGSQPNKIAYTSAISELFTSTLKCSQGYVF